MTGGQDVAGPAHGARADALAGARGRQARSSSRPSEPERYRGVALAAIAEVRDRDELAEARRELAEVQGVTVLIHDQACAAEMRRARKRGKARRAAAAHRHQRARLRGLRRLRREVQLPVGAAGGDRVRPQDADPPGVVQQGLLVRQGRLPVVPDGRRRPKQRASRRRPPPSRPPTCPSPRCASPRDDFRMRMPASAAPASSRSRQILGMAAMLDGKHVLGPGPDRPRAEGRPGRSPTCGSRATRDRGLQQGVGRRDRPDARLRPARRRQPARTSRPPTPSGPSPWSPRPRSRPRAMVIDTGVRFPALDAQPRGDRRRPRAATSNVYLDAAGAQRGAVRRPHADQHAADRRGLPARLPADLRRRRSSRPSASTAPPSRRTSRRSAGAAP